MTFNERKHIIKTALKQAGELWLPRGCDLDRYVGYLIEGGEYQGILLTPAFARAFFGTEAMDLWEQVRDTFDDGGQGGARPCHGDYCDNCGHRMTTPVWRYHLQRMVLCDCVEYLRRYMLWRKKDVRQNTRGSVATAGR